MSVESDFINQYEFRICAHKRSGHHAFIEWILENTDGHYVFLNNLHMDTNPYNYDYIARRSNDRLITNIDYDFETDPFDKIKHYKKKLLMYNFENKPPSKCFSRTFQDNIEEWVGKSEKIMYVFFVRDPFNAISSYAKKTNGDLKKIKKFIKDYVSIYLESFNYIKEKPANSLRVIYNNWLFDPSYRMYLGERLELVMQSPDVQKRVAKWGSGSSFKVDENYDNKIFETRWKNLLNYPEVIDIVLENKKFLKISKEIYSQINNIDYEEIFFELSERRSKLLTA